MLNSIKDKTKTEKYIKEKLVKTQQTIRNKFKHAYNDRIAKERRINDSFKPVTSKIDALIDLNKEEKRRSASRRSRMRTFSENTITDDDNSYWWDGGDNEHSHDSFAESADDSNSDGDLDIDSNMLLATRSHDSIDAEADNANNEAMAIQQDLRRSSKKRKPGGSAGSNNPKKSSIDVTPIQTLPIASAVAPLQLMRKTTQRIFQRPRPVPQSRLLSIRPGTANITDDNTDENDENGPMLHSEDRQKTSGKVDITDDGDNTDGNDENGSMSHIGDRQKPTGKVYVKRFPNRDRYDPTRMTRMQPPIRRSLEDSLGSDSTRVGKHHRKRITGRKTIGPKSKVQVQRKTKRVQFQEPAPTPPSKETQPSTSRQAENIETQKVKLSRDSDLYDKLVKRHGKVFRPDDEILLIEGDDEVKEEDGALSPKRKKGVIGNTPRKRTKVRHIRRIRKGEIVDFDSDDSGTSDDSNLPMPLPIRRSARVNSLNIPKPEEVGELTEDENTDDHVHGKGIESDFIPYRANTNIVYEYFDDPNELCDRLRLLVSSKAAGNSNHTQEINSIVSELRELGLIK